MVAKWNAANPNIQVTASNQAQGDELVTKLLTAAKAGNAPDLVQAEYQALPTLVSNDALADIAGDVGDAKGDFAEGVWQTVTLGTDAVYAVPQDIGPMMLYYRADLFTQLGLTVPKTWDEFAQAARVRQKSPNQLPDHVLLGRPGLVRRARPAGRRELVGRAGRRLEGVGQRRRDEEGRRLLGRPRRRGRRRQPADVHARVEQGPQRRHADRLAQRGLGPGVLSGNAADTKGKWDDGAACRSGAPARTRPAAGAARPPRSRPDSEHKAAAAEFAVWLNTDPEATADPRPRGRHLPAHRRPPSGPALASAPEFFANQPDFYQLAKRDRGHGRGLHLRPERERHLQRVQGRVRQGDHARKAPFGGAVDTMQAVTVRRHEEERLQGRRDDQTTASAERTASRAAPYAFLAPAVVLFDALPALPIGYAAYLSLRKVKVSGLGLGRAPAARSSPGWRTTAAR